TRFSRDWSSDVCHRWQVTDDTYQRVARYARGRKAVEILCGGGAHWWRQAHQGSLLTPVHVLRTDDCRAVGHCAVCYGGAGGEVKTFSVAWRPEVSSADGKPTRQFKRPQVAT